MCHKSVIMVSSTLLYVKRVLVREVDLQIKTQDVAAAQIKRIDRITGILAQSIK